MICLGRFGGLDPRAALIAGLGLALPIILAAAVLAQERPAPTQNEAADPLKTLCAGPGASLLGGMAPMYLLMSAFHSTPWLGLIGRRGIRRTAA